MKLKRIPIERMAAPFTVSNENEGLHPSLGYGVRRASPFAGIWRHFVAISINIVQSKKPAYPIP
jgi:hypothetical protein